MREEKLLVNAYNDAASPAMKQVGQMAEGVMKFVALPFKFLGMTAEQLETTYKTFIEDALKKVPEKNRKMPRSSIAGPLLEQVKYCFDDEVEVGNNVLREMYSSLLASAMNKEYEKIVQPSFLERLKCCSGYDAIMLNSLYHSNSIGGKRISHFALEYSGSSERYEYTVFPTDKSSLADYPIMSVFDSLKASGLIHIYKTEDITGIEYVSALRQFCALAREGEEERLKFIEQPKRFLIDKNKEIFLSEIGDFFMPSNLAHLIENYDTRKRVYPARARYDAYDELLKLKLEVLELDNAIKASKQAGRLVSKSSIEWLDCCRFIVNFTHYGAEFMNCCLF